jgi:CPA1 family monovalent cation:H+ antiporter
MIKDLKHFMIPGLWPFLVVCWQDLSLSGGLQIYFSRRSFSPQTVKVLVWGGIRGGVSIALAMSIPKVSTVNHSVLRIV